jgi:hypothetical protein
MKRIMEAILKAKESGEIDRALEKSRIPPLGSSMGARARSPLTADQLEGLFEDVFAAYDVEFGGFGVEPKFPHSDAVESLLIKYAETNESGLLDAAMHSLERMASGLHDEVEGGVFRYSVTRDWITPHYEKMLETNTGFLRNLVHAHTIAGNRGFDLMAKDIAKYVLTNLRNEESGGFYGSQDADEEYYRLDSTGRRKRGSPSVDKTVYAGWNADASAILILAGSVLGDEEMIKAGRKAWDNILRRLWNPTLGLVRHLESEETYLFEDQVAFLGALMTQLELSMDDAKIELGERLILSVDKAFANARGGFSDITRSGKAIGELDTPRRPLVENSNWALTIAHFGSATHNQDLVGKAREILDSFALSDIEAYGVFAAAYLRARWALDRGITVVEAHAPKGNNPFRLPVQYLLDPAIVQAVVAEEDPKKSYAVVCTATGCSEKVDNPDRLSTVLTEMTDSRMT